MGVEDDEYDPTVKMWLKIPCELNGKYRSIIISAKPAELKIKDQKEIKEQPKKQQFSVELSNFKEETKEYDIRIEIFIDGYNDPSVFTYKMKSPPNSKINYF